MLILEKPYVSELLIDTIVQNDWPVLNNQVIKNSEIEDGAFDRIPSNSAKNFYLAQEFPLIYSNSDIAQDWVLKNLPKSNLSDYIRLFKNKIMFRDFLKPLYPNFFYKKISIEELKTLDISKIPYPIIIKPTNGFQNIGAYCINSLTELHSIIPKLEQDILYLTKDKNFQATDFIIEEYVEGEEFIIDAYFDRDGEAVILNIFQHPIINKSNISDRIYLTSANIIIKYLAKFSMLLRNIGPLKNIRNLPIQMKVRVKKDGSIIPIEINPMRFANWCASDIAKYSWGINVYECFLNQNMPDWNAILSEAKNQVFYYSIAEKPIGIDIKEFNYNKWLNNYSNILEVRRIDYTKNPIFALIFGIARNNDEIIKILSLKINDYIS